MIIGIPAREDVTGIWEHNTTIFGLGVLYHLEKLGNNLRFARDFLLRRTSEDKENIISVFDVILFLFVANAATHFHWLELALTIRFSATV